MPKGLERRGRGGGGMTGFSSGNFRATTRKYSNASRPSTSVLYIYCHESRSAAKKVSFIITTGNLIKFLFYPG